MSLLNNLRVLNDVRIGGNLEVAGTTTSSVTSISTTNLNITDRHMYVNKDHTTWGSGGGANEPAGGYVVNAKALMTVPVDDTDPEMKPPFIANGIRILPSLQHTNALNAAANATSLDNSITIYEFDGSPISSIPDYYVGWTFTRDADTTEYEVVDYIIAGPGQGVLTLSAQAPALTSTSSIKLEPKVKPGDFIQVSGSRNHLNDGVFMVDRYDDSTSLVTISTSVANSIMDFIQQSIVEDTLLQSDVDASPSVASANARISHIRVSVMRHEADGSVIVSYGKNGNELIVNQTVVAPGSDRPACIVIDQGLVLPAGFGVVSMGAATGGVVLDLSGVPARNLAKVYLFNAGNADPNMPTMKLKLPNAMDPTIKDNTQIRVIRRTENNVTCDIETPTASGTVFDDEPGFVSMSLTDNAQKVDLSSASCGGLNTWYMG